MIFGLYIFLLSYGLIYLFPREVRKAYLIVLSIHALIILFYAYSDIVMLGATEDADSFYKHAVDRSMNIANLDWSIIAMSNGHDFFKNIHALLQYFFSGPQKIISYSTSLLAWSLCTLILTKLYLSICSNDYKGARIAIYLFSLTPSILIFNSYFLREVWLSLFIFSIIYFAVSLKNYYQKIFVILLISLISILFHRFMVVITSAVIFSILIYDTIDKYSWYPFNNFKLFLYFGLIIIAALIILNLDIEAVIYLKTNGLINGINQYSIGLVGGTNDGGPPARASYGKIFDKDNLFSIFEVFKAYMLMPYPWRISSIFDFAPFIENLIRLSLIIIFITSRKNLNSRQKMIVDMILLIWLSVELIWSFGTINWGTAYRHHSVVYGLLIVMSLAALRGEITKKKKHSTHD